MRPSVNVAFDKNSSSSLLLGIGAVAYGLVCFAVAVWLLGDIITGFLLLPVAMALITGAAIVLMFVAAPFLIVLYYIVLIAVALVSFLIKPRQARTSQ